MSMKTALPPIEPDTPVGIARFLWRVREILETLLGDRGSKTDKVVTYGDLVELGLISKDDL